MGKKRGQREGDVGRDGGLRIVRLNESAKTKEIPDAGLAGLTSGIPGCGCREGLFFRWLFFFVVVFFVVFVQLGYLFFG